MFSEQAITVGILAFANPAVVNLTLANFSIKIIPLLVG